jgi:hypothetical protein
MTHLSLSNLDMAQELEDEFIENEARLQRLSLPTPLINQMNSVMREWLVDFKVDTEKFLPGHGPGSVAEFQGDKTLYSKYQTIQPDMMIEYVFHKFAGIDPWTCVPLERGVPTSRQSTVCFVPKSIKTLRVISKEPTTLMYFQQGVRREIEKLISSHKYLSKHIDFHSQYTQQIQALNASRTRAFATVDLSAASDSVSWDLVKGVFRGTALYPYLAALRSQSSVLPSGKVIEVRKFAPMGSALCFPIQTLIFACLAECTARYVRYETGISNFQYHVYGDDIIVPDHCLYDLTIFLRQCGFRINEFKTYGGSNRFRESCGCDAYDGVDVTCMKIGRRFSSRQVAPRSPNVFEGLIAMANSSLDYDFPSVRRYLVDKLINDTRYVPMFSEDRNVGLYSSTPTNYRLPHRQNRDWQEVEVLAAGVVSVQSQLSTLKWDDRRKTFREGDPLPLAEELRLFEWLRLNSDRQHAPFSKGMSWYHGSRDAFNPEFRSEVHVGSAFDYLSKLWVVPQ